MIRATVMGTWPLPRLFDFFVPLSHFGVASLPERTKRTRRLALRSMSKLLMFDFRLVEIYSWEGGVSPLLMRLERDKSSLALHVLVALLMHIHHFRTLSWYPYLIRNERKHLYLIAQTPRRLFTVKSNAEPAVWRRQWWIWSLDGHDRVSMKVWSDARRMAKSTMGLVLFGESKSTCTMSL